MWGRYHRLRTSPEYIGFWKTLLTLVGPGATYDPMFFQHISHHIFKDLIAKTFPLPDQSDSTDKFVALTYEEENALRYVAGYVCVKRHQTATICALELVTW